MFIEVIYFYFFGALFGPSAPAPAPQEVKSLLFV